jgi:hypothetical protein
VSPKPDLDISKGDACIPFGRLRRWRISFPVLKNASNLSPIASDTSSPASDRKHAKSANFHAVSLRQRGRNLVQDRLDDLLKVTLVEMEILRRKTRDKL